MGIDTCPLLARRQSTPEVVASSMMESSGRSSTATFLRRVSARLRCCFMNHVRHARYSSRASFSL